MVSSSSDTAPPKVQKIEVDSEFSGQRLDNFLLNYLKGVPKTHIYRIIRKGEVRINGGRIKPDYRLNAGDILRIPPIRTSPEKKAIELSYSNRLAHSLLEHILYEDDGLLVINKPPGIAVHGGSGLSFGVIEALRHLKPLEKHLELVHRLDKETSGCLMIAKKRSVLRALHAQLQAKTLEKVYWALVEGVWKGQSAVSLALKKNQLSSGERIVRVAKDGQSALTHFSLLKKYALKGCRLSLIEACPKTGRTHQIRVHAAAMGHPIVGDEKYGTDTFNAMMKEKGLSGLFLHARKITLLLPGDNQALSIEAPVHTNWDNGVKQLQEE